MQARVPGLMGKLFNLTELAFPLLSFLFSYSLFIEKLMVKNMCLGGTGWLPSVKHPALDSGLCHDLRVMGQASLAQVGRLLEDSFSPFLSAPPQLRLVLFLENQ